MNKCKECESERIYHNEGVSKKNNQPYENYKCAECGYTEWVDLRKPNTNAYGAYKKPANGVGRGQAKGAAFNKSVDVVIAAYNKGEVKFEDIPDFVLKVFGKFKEINLEE